MELSWNQSSPVPDYSGDTFTSFSEEEEETCREYDNEPFASYSSGEDTEWPASWDRSENTNQSSSQNSEVIKNRDFLDPAASREYLTRKWINRLNVNKATTTAVARSTVEPANALTRIPEASEEELGALQSFCAVKINWLHHPPSLAPPKRRKYKNQSHRRTSEKLTMGDINCIVPDQLVNRLRLKNIKETLKQLAEIEIHQPSRCPHCVEKRAELAESDFLRRRKVLMEKVLLQEKLEDYMYTRDSLTLIGEIHQTLPKLSDDPRHIWQRLKERALKSLCEAS
ncbi:uncharacterized protein C8orf48 homolog [Anolis sagrei]|uniref:uncharacterized protein C8orf48 homolog n=1 Tax=Anolis sagrei TaxID=38937 RepID=UPI0035226316